MTTLRDYQEAEVAAALKFAYEAMTDSGPLRRLATFPAGTGKGTIQLAILEEFADMKISAWILTPSLDIVRGLLSRIEDSPDVSALSAAKLAEVAAAYRISTPRRFERALRLGLVEAPEVIISDECHHDVDSGLIAGNIAAFLPRVVWLGYTATPYRGSARGTAELRSFWGGPHWGMDIPDAIEAGWQKLPTFSIIPLVDDDRVKVTSGEFQPSSALAEIRPRAGEIAQFIAEKGIHVPSVLTVPSSEAAKLMHLELATRHVRGWWVSAKTPQDERAAAYEMCRAGKCILISIKVLSEGVDLPWLRRLYDVRPTTSAVSFIQQTGRIMRPAPGVPEYYCFCRNLERHSYLLQGCIPRAKIVEAQTAFEQSSYRSSSRVLALDGIGRFKSVPLPLDGGGFAHMHAIYTVDSRGVKTEYASIVAPWIAEPLTATRQIRPGIGRERFGKYALAPIPEDVSGFGLLESGGKLSDKQRQWWERSGRRFGLDPEAAESITRRQFAALPVLSDTRSNILRGGSR